MTFNIAITSGPAVIAAVAACGLPVETTTTYTVLNDDATTAASVTVGGRVTNSFGIGIGGAHVTMGSALGVSRTAVTNPRGYYSFEDVEAGETYIFSVKAKGYSFQPRIITVNDAIDDLNFVPTLYQGDYMRSKKIGFLLLAMLLLSTIARGQLETSNKFSAMAYLPSAAGSTENPMPGATNLRQTVRRWPTPGRGNSRTKTPWTTVLSGPPR